MSTAQLLSEKYKTHPGRADELTRRAIYALKLGAFKSVLLFPITLLERLHAGKSDLLSL